MWLEKNVTKGVNITGAHSPEGSTKVNESLAGRRASAIEKYYRAQMDRYDYKDEAVILVLILFLLLKIGMH